MNVRERARSVRPLCTRLLGGERRPWRLWSIGAAAQPHWLLLARPRSAGRRCAAGARLGQQYPIRARPEAPLGCRGSVLLADRVFLGRYSPSDSPTPARFSDAPCRGFGGAGAGGRPDHETRDATKGAAAASPAQLFITTGVLGGGVSDSGVAGAGTRCRFPTRARLAHLCQLGAGCVLVWASMLLMSYLSVCLCSICLTVVHDRGAVPLV